MNNETFDSYYHARRDYSLYQDYYDPTDDLPPGIFSSIIRPEPELDEDFEEPESEMVEDEPPDYDTLNW